MRATGFGASWSSKSQIVDSAPAVRASEFRGELLLRLRRADDLASASLAQPREILGAGHAAVGDPDPSVHTIITCRSRCGRPTCSVCSHAGRISCLTSNGAKIGPDLAMRIWAGRLGAKA
jgi:hypothetical protein